jgi:nitrate reductase alpha subunit
MQAWVRAGRCASGEDGRRGASTPLKAKQFTTSTREVPPALPVDRLPAVWFGPFGDVYRHDRRMPSDVEGYVDINPLDAREMGVEDGDYVWIDADPEDRPFRGHEDPERADEKKVSRLLLRARYYPGTPKGWRALAAAAPGGVRIRVAEGQRGRTSTSRCTATARQSRPAPLKPTLMTETLVHKSGFGNVMAKGFEPDIHCPVGAPREAFVKITKAEPGGLGGVGKWRPAELGFRPTYESAAMKLYLDGGFAGKKG